MRSLENQRKGPGRPSVDDDTLSADRDRLVWLLSVFWGEIGWQLPRATTAEELRQAFAPIKGHPHDNLIALFVGETSVAATGKEIRDNRKEVGPAVARLRQAQTLTNKCEEASRLAELAMIETQTDQVAPMAVDLFNAWGAAMKARRDLEAAGTRLKDIEEGLKNKEASFAQHELLDFITRPKYARNPLGLGNSMAGLPNMTWQQSYARCAKIKCTQWPNFQFSLFETIKAVWDLRNSHTELSPVQLFRRQIEKLPKKVLSASRTKVENTVRSHLAENWRRLRLAVEEVVRQETDPDRIPFLVFTRFGQNLAKPRSAQDQILDANERIEA
jgi:hypothetical protein